MKFFWVGQRLLQTYKPVRLGGFWNDNYTKHKSNGYKKKTLTTKEYYDEMKPYLKDIINVLQKFDKWKI